MKCIEYREHFNKIESKNALRKMFFRNSHWLKEKLWKMDVWVSRWSDGILQVRAGGGDGNGCAHALETVLRRIDIMGCIAASVHT